MQFLQQPSRWMRAISEFRASHSGAPPFAYRLCCEKTAPQEIASLDLSRWRTAFVGAEPIPKTTLDRFVDTFSPAGFRATSFYPAYGLAEATLKVTGGIAGQGPVYGRSPEGRVLTGCGRASCGMELRIVDPTTGMDSADGVAGEVWVSGPSVARGYWRRPPATLFRSGKTYLRTGDLGLLRDGVLFITGRLKDVMVVDGRCIHPQDIERAALECSANGVLTAAAAFSIEETGRERIVLLHEAPVTDAFDAKTLARRIRAAIVGENEIDVSRIVFVKRGAIPRTTSGKVQRQQCRTLYLSGRMDEVAVAVHGAST
jgi:acyl-CoA synthetase (AMP-forming)/AMP-acid ligase II